MKTDVIILCAGESQRMGTPKMLLKYNRQNNFLTQLMSVYTKANCNIYIVVSQNNYNFLMLDEKSYLKKNTHFIINEHPYLGKFYSIQTGLSNSRSEYTYIQNIDNPFVTASLLKKMQEFKGRNSYVVPTFQGKGGHPILIHQSIKEQILSIQSPRYNIKNILIKFNRINCSASSEKILLNINTPHEYYQYFNNPLILEQDI